MAALPSVVIGFVAGLWLASRIETRVVPVLAMLVLLPLFGTAGMLLWDRLPRRARDRLKPGTEILLIVPLMLLGALVAIGSRPPLRGAPPWARGASRWQTAVRVVLPTASPGIFSAIMIGFGRAVGETMIVLMATGNTPVLDWSIFNGMRTLSANVAVEIPEAPYGGTLYRTLFLAGLVLFLMTFLVNTVAEVVRQRLRERYRAI